MMEIITEWVPCDVKMNDEIVYLCTHDDDFIIDVSGDWAKPIIEGGYKYAWIRLTSEGLQVELKMNQL